MINAVLFDLYNTLAYIAPERYREAKKQMAAKINVEPELFFELWRHYSRINNRGEIITAEERVARVLRDLGIYANRSLICELATVEYDLQERGVQLGDHSHSVLTDLRQLNLKLGLITNTGYSTMNVPSILGLSSLMDVILMSFTVRVVKPGSSIYNIACERLQVSPQDCLYVGDGDDKELEGAANVGMITVCLQETREKILYSKTEGQYDYYVESLNQLIPIARSLIRHE